MNNYYEQIRQACIKIRPEILDLKMGCEVKRFETGEKIIVMKEISAGLFLVFPGLAKATLYEKDKYQILGRPLHLEDILMVLRTNEEKIPGQIALNMSGYFMMWTVQDGWKIIEPNIYYNLSKSPQDQSEETLKFICDNIK